MLENWSSISFSYDFDYLHETALVFGRLCNILVPRNSSQVENGHFMSMSSYAPTFIHISKHMPAKINFIVSFLCILGSLLTKLDENQKSDRLEIETIKI